MFKPFYVHYNPYLPGVKLKSFHNRGFTAKLSPTEDNKVVLQVALCSPKDQFCKRVGREVADEADELIISKTAVPGVLAKLSEYSFPVNDREFFFVFRYLL